MAIPNRSVPPPGWEVVRVGDVLNSQRHSVQTAPAQTYREIGIRSHGKGIFHKPAVTGEEIGDKRVFRVVPDCLVLNIVFAWEGAVAVTSANESGMIASHRFPMFAPARPDVVDVEFLRRYFLTKHGTKLLGDVSPGGAGRNRTLNQSSFASLTLPLPPLPEQKKIAAILSSVDETIAKTESVIAQLQIVKKAMMEQLLTKGMPGRHTRFKQTEIGEIPQEWEVVDLGSLLDGIDAGWSPLCDTRSALDGEWGVLKVSAVTWGTFDPSENKKLPDDLVPRPEIVVCEGDVLLSRANTPELVGRCVFVEAAPPRLMLSDKLLRLRFDRTLAEPRFVNFLLSAPTWRELIQDASTGSSSSMKNISQGKLRSLPIPKPPLNEQVSIADMISSQNAVIREEESVLCWLLTLKSALSSSLLSGEIRVIPEVA